MATADHPATSGEAPTCPNAASALTVLTCFSAKKSPFTVRIISGSVGSIITSLVVTPLEVAKIRTQTAAYGFDYDVTPVVKKNTDAIGRKGAPIAPCSKGCGTMVLFNGHMDCLVTKESFHSAFIPSIGRKGAAMSMPGTGVVSVLRRIFVQEGFTGIYAGLWPTLLMAVPNTVMYFSIYEELVWRMRKNSIANDRPPAWYYPLVGGAVARTVASSVTAPFEYIRTRQAANGGSATMLTELQTIVRTDGRGMLALYEGLRPTLWRDVPFSAIYWFCIEELRAMWKERQKHGVVISPMELAGQEFANGAMSGMIAAAVTTPFDVVKTRQQTASFAKAANQAQAVQALCSHNGAIVPESSSEGMVGGRAMSIGGTFRTMRQIAAQEGFASLWRGNQARMLKVAPSCAIMISSYEFGKRIL